MPITRRKFARVVVRFDFRGQQLELAGGELRLGLRHVGAGDLADIEAVARLAQRFVQHPHVAALHVDDRGVAQQIHVDGGGGEQHRLLHHAQRFARGRNLPFRQTGAVGGLEAVEQGLRSASRQPCKA